jgi:hypothetical protein
MNKNKIKSTIKTTLVILVIVAIVWSFISYTCKTIEYEYRLYEMNDGVYAIYYNTHSNVPANNYEVVTLCCGGNVHTFRGNVFISFTDSEPYARVRNCNIVNGDDIYVYVPQGTVSYQSSVYVGR